MKRYQELGKSGDVSNIISIELLVLGVVCHFLVS